MTNEFGKIAFTDAVKQMQTELGSRSNYERMESRDWHNDELGPEEMEFIRARDSFYMASVSETDWPYVQHRGGPAGFVKILNSKTIAFPDYRGNRQYVSVGNFRNNDRVALILMDYPNRLRLKVLGHAEVFGVDAGETKTALETMGYEAKVERGILVRVAAFDWNCPQHITPRYTEAEWKESGAR